MAQSTKVIDINRSYVPIDPNSFPESMHSTQAEDAPEGRVPVVPYDGYNFMPTAYGYMSYFGMNSVLGVDPLTQDVSPFDPARVDDLFIVQTPDLRNIFVALCEDGIYTKYGAETGAWTHAITLDIPEEGTHKNWTKTVIGNEVYLYRAGEDNIWVMRDDEDFVPTALTPSTNLNMSAQQGIFKAGARLGIWDSANSISWSDVDDKMDHIPSLETGAGNAIFQKIVGKIVNILPHGNGFVIYCTRSIVYVRRNSDANFFWTDETVFSENGISYLNECAYGQPDTLHFAYTTFGIVKIENGQATYIFTELFTCLKEKRDPVYIRVLEGRYVFFEFLNPDFKTGIPNFSYESVPGTTITLKGASYTIDHITENPCKAIRVAGANHEELYLNQVHGYTSKSQATETGDVPIWEDHLSSGIDIDIINAWKTYNGATFGDYLYFSEIPFDQGAIEKIDGSGNEYFIPVAARNLPSTTGFSATMHVENNTKDFYSKQNFIFLYERMFFDSWKKAITQKELPLITIDSTEYSANAGSIGAVITSAQTAHEFGPYLDFSYFSEANKYYGIAEKSAWLQRSLTRGVKVNVTETQNTITANSREIAWVWGGSGIGDGNCGGPYASYAAALSSVGDALAYFNSLGATTYTLSSGPFDEIGPPGSGVDTGRHIRFVIGVDDHVNPPFTIPAQLVASDPDSFAQISTDPGVQTTGQPAYKVETQQRQYFAVPKFVPVEYDTCMFKELGYTKIKGKGHYNLDGSFTEDFGEAGAPLYDNNEAGALEYLLDVFGALPPP